MSDDKKVIFSMSGVSKLLPSGKQILKNIHLSFFYGAKIGILGLNGSGKSTLLKLIAGVDKSYQGDISFSPGYSVGYLQQEPELDDTKTVKQVIEEGVQETVDVLKEFEEIKTSLIFETPNYKVRVGVFKTLIDASKSLENIKRKFRGAFILKNDEL